MRVFAHAFAHHALDQTQTTDKISSSILNLIGNTPILELNKLAVSEKVKVYAKAEFLNPSGSIKDRMVHYIIEAAERRGNLSHNDVIVEASSGNTGVSVAMISAKKGYKAVIVVPDTTSKIKTKMMKWYGAEIVYTPSEEGIYSTVLKAREIAEEKKAFLLNQFKNVDNIRAHHSTGKEILNQVGEVDTFVAGIGTGGTLIGVAEVLKDENSETRIVAVEPAKVPAFYNIFYGTALPILKGIPHSIEGIGESFVPKILNDNRSLVDDVILVGDKDAFSTMKRLAAKEGIFVGVSSGANVYTAIKLAKNINESQRVVTVLPDSGQRYLLV